MDSISQIKQNARAGIDRRDMTEDEKHRLTYEVAEGDIDKQRKAEKRNHQKVDRPSYHVEVATKYTNNCKTEYQVKNINRKNRMENI